ncbi:MAG: DUF72 domain-containing protein [Mycobacteriales bacterium]
MIYVGTSGWSYQSWRGTYYPAGLPAAAWFDQIMADFATVEVNASFYRLPRPGVFTSWGQRAPSDAQIAVKASRYLTHVRRLREPAEPVARLMSRAAELGRRLGPVLIQLPPDYRADLAALQATLRQFPRGVRLAVEARHPSWWSGEFAALLAEFNAAAVWADRRSRPIAPTGRTAGWGYLRMHEGATNRPPAYGIAALRSWVGRIAATFEPQEDVYVYFNNDPGGAAPRDALRFAGLLARRGMTTSVQRRNSLREMAGR